MQKTKKQKKTQTSLLLSAKIQIRSAARARTQIQFKAVEGLVQVKPRVYIIEISASTNCILNINDTWVLS